MQKPSNSDLSIHTCERLRLKRLGRYKSKGIVYVSLGSGTKNEVERLASIDGITTSNFIRKLVEREIGRREATLHQSWNPREEED